MQTTITNEQIKAMKDGETFAFTTPDFERTAEVFFTQLGRQEKFVLEFNGKFIMTTEHASSLKRKFEAFAAKWHLQAVENV